LTSGTISYDFDVDPQKRRKTPSFYGYVPDKGSHRMVLFIAMTVNGALMLLGRSISVALLLSHNGSYFAIYCVSDLLIFHLHKILRGDYAYWLPIYGSAEVLVWFLARTMAKVVADYTAVFQLRHCRELGGAYFTWNMASGIGFIFVTVSLYFEKHAPLEGNFRAVWPTVTGFVLLWLLNFMLCIFMMKKKYRATFLSTTTGKADCLLMFMEAKTDMARSQIFFYHAKLWRDIRDDVRVWVSENYWRWEDEKPEWYSDILKHSIDADLMPSGVDLQGLELSLTGKLLRGRVSDRHNSVVAVVGDVFNHERNLGNIGFTKQKTSLRNFEVEELEEDLVLGRLDRGEVEDSDDEDGIGLDRDFPFMSPPHRSRRSSSVCSSATMLSPLVARRKLGVSEMPDMPRARAGQATKATIIKMRKPTAVNQAVAGAQVSPA